MLVVDGEAILSNNRQVTYETVPLVMKVLRGHTEEIQFDLATIGTHMVILGMPWLRQHNPNIDWYREQIVLDRCSCGGDRRTPKLRRENASLGQERICAASQEPEYLAQDSVLKKIPAAYKEYESLFQEGPRNEALPKH